VALNGTDRAVNVRDCLALGNFTHEDFAILCECDNRWSGASTFRVCDNDGFSAFKYGNH
jgi:hypothetical protein